MTHSWSGNIAIFSAQSVEIKNGLMTLSLRPAPSGTQDSVETKQFYGAEVRSKDTITYGKIVARAKFAKGSAVVSSLVAIYPPGLPIIGMNWI
ncbi:MAG TPA: hypothetical protein VIZ65_07065 [Cellvibrionaceae bacterium]